MPRGSDTALRLSYALKASAPRQARAQALGEIESALRRHRGNISHAAAYLGVGRMTFHRWLATYPRLRKALEAAKREGPLLRENTR